jgi:hypothetical protein
LRKSVAFKRYGSNALKGKMAIGVRLNHLWETRWGEISVMAADIATIGAILDSLSANAALGRLRLSP